MCQLLCLCLLAPTREHLRPDLAPEQTRGGVVAGAELRCAAGPGLRFLQPIDRVERLREIPRRGRQVALLAQLREQPARFCTELGRGGGIVGQELDLAGHPGRPREQECRASVGQHRT